METGLGEARSTVCQPGGLDLLGSATRQYALDHIHDRLARYHANLPATLSEHRRLNFVQETASHPLFEKNSKFKTKTKKKRKNKTEPTLLNLTHAVALSTPVDLRLSRLAWLACSGRASTVLALSRI